MLVLGILVVVLFFVLVWKYLDDYLIVRRRWHHSIHFKDRNKLGEGPLYNYGSDQLEFNSTDNKRYFRLLSSFKFFLRGIKNFTGVNES